jgi:hypothetical protein
MARRVLPSDHDDFRSHRSKIMNVIGFKKLERDHADKFYAICVNLIAPGKPVPTFPHSALAVFTAFALLLASCSNFERPRRPAWRTQAENACIAQKLVRVSAYVQPAREIDGPSICGLTKPFKVTALQEGEVAFNSTYTLDCPMIATLNNWLAETVQPVALARFGQKVVQINGMGAYSCRGINNQPGARFSEHAFGNAIDIGGFRLADGREISIVRDWTRGDEQTQAFLRDVHAGACDHFTTVLGPGANVFHYNHIHIDLAMHGNTSTGPRRVCKPDPRPTIAPERRDNLPDAPVIEDDLDIAQAGAPPMSQGAGGTPAVALHPGPGPAPNAGIPANVPLPPARVGVGASPSRPLAYTPIHPSRSGTVRDDGSYVPEGQPEDWDITSSIPR